MLNLDYPGREADVLMAFISQVAGHTDLSRRRAVENEAIALVGIAIRPHLIQGVRSTEANQDPIRLVALCKSFIISQY
jgi:hypothetical protein